MKVLCIGDVVSKEGCDFLIEELWRLKREWCAELVIVNGENSACGNGIDKSSIDAIFCAGADIITGGNHSFQKRSAAELLEQTECLLRPLNIEGASFGRGEIIYDMGRLSVRVINLMGSLFIDGTSNPFVALDRLLREDERYITIIDFHAEATGEKQALARLADGRAALVFGTHTHVLTADAKILPGGTGYITDIGMTGVKESIIGKAIAPVLNNFIHPSDRVPISDATGQCMLTGIFAEIDEVTKKCISIQPVVVDR